MITAALARRKATARRRGGNAQDLRAELRVYTILIPRASIVALVALSVCGSSWSAPAAPGPGAPPPLLVVLTETGRARDGLPVFTRQAPAAPFESALLRGFSGRLLRLYRAHQIERSRREATAVEPAYLLLSGNQGGFPREGFYLDDERKAGVRYVDLYRSQPLSGRFGAIDQIFPHELMHVIQTQTIGPAPDGGSNQVHAIGVRTDPVLAFNEGFAEHAQVMAVDDPDALPETRALASDRALLRWAEERFEAYRRAVSARIAVAPRAIATFPIWFSNAEHVLRYHGVKDNRFVREPAIPERLLRGPDPYAAYLLENVVPPDAGGPRKPVERALATEGVVSALFARWVVDPEMRHPGPPGLYAECDLDPARLEPIDHVYLKLFGVLRHARPVDTAGVIRAYRAAYPGEAAALDRVTASVLGTADLAEAKSIWLANDAWRVGTSLFDQFRALPRTHTFDLNAASVVDLVSVPGVDARLARSLLEGAPYARVEDVARVPGTTTAVVERFRGMERAMNRIRGGVEAEGELTLGAILRPYLIRALWVWLATALAGAVAYRLARRVAWWRAAANGFAAALATLLTGWLLDPGHGVYALAIPLFLFALPGTVFAMVARAGRVSWRRVPVAWVAATLPAWLVLRTWG